MWTSEYPVWWKQTPANTILLGWCFRWNILFFMVFRFHLGVKQYSDSVFFDWNKRTWRCDHFSTTISLLLVSKFHPRELRLTCVFRSPWRVRRICRRCVTISHSLVWCQKTSPNIFLYSAPLSCCWSFLLPFRGRGWVWDCRSLVACLACAVVSECWMWSHRGCSNRFRVLLLKLSHVEDHSLSCHRLLCQCLFGSCSESCVSIVWRPLIHLFDYLFTCCLVFVEFWSSVEVGCGREFTLYRYVFRFSGDANSFQWDSANFVEAVLCVSQLFLSETFLWVHVWLEPNVPVVDGVLVSAGQAEKSISVCCSDVWSISLANLFLQNLPPSRVPWPHSVETLTLLVPKTLQRNLWQRLELVLVVLFCDLLLTMHKQTHFFHHLVYLLLTSPFCFCFVSSPRLNYVTNAESKRRNLCLSKKTRVSIPVGVWWMRTTHSGFCAVFRKFPDPWMKSSVPDTWFFLQEEVLRPGSRHCRLLSECLTLGW